MPLVSALPFRLAISARGDTLSKFRSKTISAGFVLAFSSTSSPSFTNSSARPLRLAASLSLTEKNRSLTTARTRLGSCFCIDVCFLRITFVVEITRDGTSEFYHESCCSRGLAGQRPGEAGQRKNCAERQNRRPEPCRQGCWGAGWHVEELNSASPATYPSSSLGGCHSSWERVRKRHRWRSHPPDASQCARRTRFPDTVARLGPPPAITRYWNYPSQMDPPDRKNADKKRLNSLKPR